MRKKNSEFRLRQNLKTELIICDLFIGSRTRVKVEGVTLVQGPGYRRGRGHIGSGPRVQTGEGAHWFTIKDVDGWGAHFRSGYPIT